MEHYVFVFVRYYDGIDVDDDWNAPGYNDSSWGQGPAPLGYGDDGESTVIGFGGNESDKHITAYFRTVASLSNIHNCEVN